MILVIGGTGTTGKPLVDRLLAMGQKVRIATSRKDHKEQLCKQGFDAVVVDLEDTASISSACAGVEKMYLVTPAHSQMRQWKANAISAAQDAGVRHIVMSTGLGASPKSQATFALWHSDSQEKLKASGLGWTLIQPTFFMQNLTWQIDSILSGIYRDDINGPVAWVDARDISDVAATVLTEPGHEGKTYMLTGPEALTGEQIAAILSRETGRKIQRHSATVQETFDATVAGGMSAEVAKSLEDLNALGPLGYLADTFPAPQELTGHAPRTLEQYVREHKELFQ